MIIGGIDISNELNREGVFVKNKLPDALKERLKTENQWLELGYMLKDGAIGYDMNSNMLHKRIYTYYLDDDVIESTQKNCGTCSIRTGRFCIFAGDYVNMTALCSEWTKENNR